MLQSLHRLFLAILLLAAWPALAQTDPPSRVGRLSYLEGDVGFKANRQDEGGPATLNWPVSSGAIFDSGRNGRTEVWIGSTAYRLSRDSEIEYPVVDDRRVDVRLTGGTLAVSVLDRDQADDVEVMTPDGNVRFLTPGRYRINVYADRSELVVQAGRATFDNGRRSMPVAAGQMAVLTSDGGERLEAARAYDGFDQWVAQRENATLGDTARRHVSPHMTGYQDLDAYGDWRTTNDYGSVWYPRAVASDWAPYRQGRWAWVAPWGWTWIDQAPWGFAPFHYGRWAFIAGRWGWVPGRIIARPVYAPALVGWVGNPGWSVSFSFGSAPAVGWFPLAPREVYVPAYRYSPTYVRQVNITHVTNVTHIEKVVRGAPHAYTHHASPQAVTVVPTRQMQEGRPISASEIRHHERRDLDRAPLARQAPTAQWVAPTPAATRPHDGERGGQRQRSRDFDAQRNPGAEREAFRDGERQSPRQAMPENGRGDRPRTPEGMPLIDGRGRQAESTAQPVRREIQPPGAARNMPEATRDQASEPRRENGRRPVEGGPETRPGSMRPQDAAVPVQPGRPPATDPARETAGESRREFFRRQQEGRPDNGSAQPESRRDERSQPAVTPQEREQRREMRELQRQERQSRQSEGSSVPPSIGPRDTPRPPDATATSAPVRREIPAADTRRDDRPQPAFTPQEREQRREMREMQRVERPAQAPSSVGAPQIAAPREMPRPQETQAAPPPLRRDMPPPEMRREERPQPAFQMQEREQRREMPREVPREMPRMERPVQPQPAPVMTPQAMPQREMPRPAPEVRMPPPQPPAPPPPKAEPPRQLPASPGANEPHRRRDEERGQR